MAETVGALILASVEVAGVTGAAAAGSTVIAAGITLNTVVGAAAILATSIGLQYALNNPNLPKPEDGSQPIKQAIPPRVRGYGRNRLAGPYMLYEAGGAPPARSYDVIAFHSGRVESIQALYLNDDFVAVTPDISAGGIGTVLGIYEDGRYGGDRIRIEAALGAASQASPFIISTDPSINAVWNASFRGDGIAWLAMVCAPAADPAEYTRVFPKGHPELSVVADCSPVWDPRDPAQSRLDQSTWTASRNPVLQFIDYVTCVDGGMGRDFEVAIAPHLDELMVEADLCDEPVAKADGDFEPRYECHGWFQYDNAPENVINGILSTCDGWSAELGDGSFTMVVGVYRAPEDPPLTEKHITGFSLNYGQADEDHVNQLDITFTDPEQKFVSVQTESWRDDVSIALIGAVKPKPLDLKWVQSNSQARRLAARAMQRLNPLMTGSFTTTLYGLRYLGKRWVPLQYPFVSGLQSCTVEIQDVDIDLLGGSITWKFNRISPDHIEAYDPATDEGTAPPVPPVNAALVLLREDGTFYLREDGTQLLREDA